MEEVQINKEIEKKEINIYPSKIGKRILVYLADLILCLLLSAFVFEIIVFPTFKALPGYADKTQEVSNYYRARMGILYKNELLTYKNEDEKFDMEKSLEITSDNLLSYYVFDDTNKSNEIFYHYFCDIRGKDVSYLNNIYLEFGKDYLDETKFTDLGTYKFKEDVIELFKPNFVEGDELSEKGKVEYEHFESVFFLNIYSELLKDIEENDLTSEDNEYTYNEYTDFINNFDAYYWNAVTICSVISFALSSLVLFLIIPLTNHKGRTLSEMILKVEHIYIKDISCISKKHVLVMFLFNTLNSMPILFIVSMASSGFGGVLSLTYLLVFSLVSLVFVIFELIWLIFNRLNQSPKEIITKTILCDTKLVDEYYRLSNYEF